MNVLLVEDDQMLAKSLIGLLELKPNVEIIHVSNAQSAKVKLQEQAFDLIISDYSLGPGEKGDAVLRETAKLQPKVRRILMSGGEDAGRFAKDGTAHAFYLKDSKLARLLASELDTLMPETPAL